MSMYRGHGIANKGFLDLRVSLHVWGKNVGMFRIKASLAQPPLTLTTSKGIPQSRYSSVEPIRIL
jgi:hypothetical protein